MPPSESPHGEPQAGPVDEAQTADWLGLLEPSTNTTGKSRQRRRPDWIAIATIGALFVAAIPGVGALFFAGSSLRATNAQIQIAEQDQITDRYNAAITNLGSPSIEVRLGGIYALQRLMQDSARDQPTVVAVLCAFVRDQTAGTSQARKSSDSHMPTTDVQAALTVVGTRNRADDGHSTVIDLTGANIAGTNLPGTQFGSAIFNDATLAGAFLEDTNLDATSLEHATLAGANLEIADLRMADLSNADLTGADLSGANLTGAALYHANLTDASLEEADLLDTLFESANLTQADLRGANLTNTAPSAVRTSPTQTSPTRYGLRAIQSPTDGAATLKMAYCSAPTRGARSSE